MTISDNLVSTSVEPLTPKRENKMNNSEVDEENCIDLGCCWDLNCPPMPCTPEKNNEIKNAQRQSSSKSNHEEDDQEKISQESSVVNPDFVDLDNEIENTQSQPSCISYREEQEENLSPVDSQSYVSQGSCVVDPDPDPEPVNLCSDPVLEKGIDSTTEKQRKKVKRKKHRPKVLKDIVEKKTYKRSVEKPNVKHGQKKQQEEEPRKEKKKNYVHRKSLNTSPLDDLRRSTNSNVEYEAEAEAEESITKKARFYEDAGEQKSANGNGVGVGIGGMLYPFPSPYAGFVEDYILSGASRLQFTRRELLRQNIHYLTMQRDYPELQDKRNLEPTVKKRMSVSNKITMLDSDKILTRFKPPVAMSDSDRIQRLSNQSTGKKKRLQREFEGDRHHIKKIGPLMDALVDKLEQKSLSENKALVVFEGDRRMIASGRKKKKNENQPPPHPKPKVDLESESLKLWTRLLMGKKENEDQNTSEDKIKRWKEEMQRLRNKIDLFIIRMHELQGDKRFSPWFGSVLDSVIGVLLTQNTSDKSSAEAFMSLMAAFPVGDDTEEPEVEFPDEDESSSNIFFENSSSNADEQTENFEWDDLRKQAHKVKIRVRNRKTSDAVDWEAVRCADEKMIAEVISRCGCQNVITGRIKVLLNRLLREHGSLDLEWLKDVPPEKAIKFLISIDGVGLKSAQCIGLLSLRHHAFPVDVNIARISVRLGWVPLQPLPLGLLFHLLEMYPDMDVVQRFLWPRLSEHSFEELYEIHYQLITFGKVFCTKVDPNCIACPMKNECKHYASAHASERLTGAEEQGISVSSAVPPFGTQNTAPGNNPISSRPPKTNNSMETRTIVKSVDTVPVLASLEITNLDHTRTTTDSTGPTIEIPTSPELHDIEDFPFCSDSNEEIPILKLINTKYSPWNMQTSIHAHDFQDREVSKALAPVDPRSRFTPTPKLKNVKRLRTEHQAYELPDAHPILLKMRLPRRVEEDKCSYLLAIWGPEESPDPIPIRARGNCTSHNSDTLCSETSVPTNTVKDADSETVRVTLLLPCKTAMRGKFPLNGTHFQTNELVADDHSSYNPIDVPRNLLWNLQQRTVYFGNAVSSVFKELDSPQVSKIYWQDYVCLRGFNRETRKPTRLAPRLHITPADAKKRKEEFPATFQ